MIYDLALEKEVSKLTDISVDICIIGAGTSGIYLAHKLKKSGLKILILEEGGLNGMTPKESDHVCIQKNDIYNGAEKGRSFGLGGTSALWGGQMIPLSESDFEERTNINFLNWPIKFNDILPYINEVIDDLNLPRLCNSKSKMYKQQFFPKLDNTSKKLKLRLSQWLPFKKRNFGKLYFKELRESVNIDVWVNAPVLDIIKDNAKNQIDSVKVKSLGQNFLYVRPSILVIGAGAIESTRLLLRFDKDNAHSITKLGAPLGNFFSDHLSVTCGEFKCYDLNSFNLLTSPIFRKGIMHSARLELSQEAQTQLNTGSAFSHITYKTHKNSEFDLIRSLLKRRQNNDEKIPKISIKLFAKSFFSIASMVFWRFFYKRLKLSESTTLLLQLDIEQFPDKGNKLYLSERLDSLGREMVNIEWEIKEIDRTNINKIKQLMVLEWQKIIPSSIATVEMNQLPKSDDINNIYDVFHPTGTICMGDNNKNSVLNKDLCLWALDNCYVTTTAIFPSAGSANPGLTHLALTARLADHIIKIFDRK